MGFECSGWGCRESSGASKTQKGGRPRFEVLTRGICLGFGNNDSGCLGVDLEVQVMWPLLGFAIRCLMRRLGFGTGLPKQRPGERTILLSPNATLFSACDSVYATLTETEGISAQFKLLICEVVEHSKYI